MQALGVLPPDVRTRIEHLRERADLRGDSNPANPVPGARTARGRDHPWCRRWRFGTRAGAERWNREWERVLETPGTLHPALVQIEGEAIRDLLLDGLARVAGSVLCEEIRAGSPYPFVRPDGAYALEVIPQLGRFALPRFQESLVLVVRGAVSGPDGEPLWSSEAAREISFELVPESVATLWSERVFPATDETYR